jgi:hypothetical protein
VKQLFCLLCIFLLFPLLTFAATTDVNCALPGKAGSINETLRQLDPAGPNTLVLHGNCHENIVISGFDRLTIRGAKDAVLSDPSGGTEWAVILITNSRRIKLRGLYIVGGNTGVVCTNASFCDFQANTMEEQSQNGFSINDSEAAFSGDVVSNSGGAGFNINRSKAQLTGITAENDNTGININASTVVGENWNVTHNQGPGVFVASSSHLQLIDSQVTFNSQNGIQATAVSSLSLVNNTVTGNVMSGVWLSDIVTAFFVGGNYSGNDQTGSNFNIGCYGQYTVISNLSSASYSTTNCAIH